MKHICKCKTKPETKPETIYLLFCSKEDRDEINFLEDPDTNLVNAILNEVIDINYEVEAFEIGSKDDFISALSQVEHKGYYWILSQAEYKRLS